MQYFKKEVNDEVYFLHAGKHRRLLQIGTIILSVCNHACPKYPKQVSISLQYFQKSMGDEVDFLSIDKHKSFLKIDCITLRVRS